MRSTFTLLELPLRRGREPCFEAGAETSLNGGRGVTMNFHLELIRRVCGASEL